MTRPRDAKLRLSKVNTPPRGLQSFLGNVNQGVNPHELDHTISPTVELSPFWGIDQVKGGLASLSISGTVGQGVTVVVPPGQVWQVIAASCDMSLVATESLGLSLNIQDPSGGIMQAVVSEDYIIGTPSVTRLSTGLVFTPHLILPTGWGLRGMVTMATDATNRTMEVNYMYIPLQA